MVVWAGWVNGRWHLWTTESGVKLSLQELKAAMYTSALSCGTIDKSENERS